MIHWPRPRARQTRVLAALTVALLLASTAAAFLEDVRSSAVTEAVVVPVESQPNASTDELAVDEAALVRAAPTSALAKSSVIDTGSIGGSLYDWRTTDSGLWPEMQGLRR